MYELRVHIQNDSMRLLDRTEERPDIENKGLRKHFIETSHTHSAFSVMVIYTYEMHTNLITNRLSHTHTHTHLSNRQPRLGDPDFIDVSPFFLRKTKHTKLAQAYHWLKLQQHYIQGGAMEVQDCQL